MRLGWKPLAAWPGRKTAKPGAGIREPASSPVRERHPAGGPVDPRGSGAAGARNPHAASAPAGRLDLREFTWYHLLRRCHTERHTLSGHRGDVYYVEFSPRGDLLASTGKDGLVRIWNTASWQLVRSIKASGTEVNVSAFSPDGKTLATVDDEGKLKLWEIATGRCQLEKLAEG